MAPGGGERTFTIVGRESGQNSPFTLSELRDMAITGEINFDTELRDHATGETVIFRTLLPLIAPSMSSEGAAAPTLSATRDSYDPRNAPKASNPTRRLVWVMVGITAAVALCCGLPLMFLGPAFARAREAQAMTINMARIKNLSVALLSYSADYQDTLPPDLTNGAAIRPFVVKPGEERPRTMPFRGHGGEFRGNPKLAGKKVFSFQNPDTLILLYETKSWSNGKRAVAFLDASARYVPDAELKEVTAKDFRLKPVGP